MDLVDVVFLVVAPLALLVALPVAWGAAMVWRPTMFVTTGRFEAAREAAERLERCWLRVFSSVRTTARYTRALSLHLEGRFEESLASLADLEPTSMDHAFEVLEAGNLVMQNRSAARAAKLLTLPPATRGARPAAEDEMLLAVALHMAGDKHAAARAFERAGTHRPRGAPWPRLNDPVFHYLRALYLVRTGRAAEGAADLEAAASSPIVTIYVQRARALLPPTSSSSDVDPRSSLSGQVMDE